ncbi:DUF5711 family protein [Porcipelethomonas ammoniilytica]|uniref:DUF5711 family protein n=1 Tax=Porcipelethomonas ammoniilytica TaxID=2981722 RepID=UPI0008228177|nr:DUF5711 family protein [Porcipelethomonas ammoniilytica]MCU6719393.1 DUF5711 family protein [Porcipelethomonas ammoniilytica]SCI79470.1 Uncharacterised protein [uncultured Ruminococcus sp.]
MEKNIKDVDIVILRRRRKRRRQMAKFIAFILLASIIFGLYVKRDVWFPKLEGIGSRFQSVKSSGGELSGENFPLNISGGIDYQVGNLNGYLAILSDAYIYIYTEDGELYEERQHAYANAMLQTSGKKALIYESGGNKFRIDNKRKNLYTKKMEQNIIFARISENGNVAVITTSDTYICKLTVFDDSGEEIYSRNCVERVIDLTFNEDGTGCILATSDAADGEIISKIISVSFDSKKDKWTSDALNTMCLKTYYDRNGILVLGDTKCAYYSNNGELLTSYDYPSSLVDWDYRDGKIAMLFENEIKRQNYFTTIDSEKREPNQNEFSNSSANCIRISGGQVLILSKEGIIKYDFNGGGEKNISSESAYEKFILIDNYIFLLGYDRIDRIEYKG